jgi:SNF2 family DNA or RNA helicase
MIRLEKLEKGTYFEDAFKVSFRYDPETVEKIKKLAYRRYLPEDRAWEIPASELVHLVDIIGVENINIDSRYLEGIIKKEAGVAAETSESVKERLKGIKPIIAYPFKTKPFPHQIEAFNVGNKCTDLLLADDQGLGKTKESIDIAVSRKEEIGKCLIVCGVNSVKYNWSEEIKIHSDESSIVIDGKTVDKRLSQIREWIYGNDYFGIINIESLRNEKIMDLIYDSCKNEIIGAVIVDEIHKAKNGMCSQGRSVRNLNCKVRIGLSGTPMNKAEDLWNILTWLRVEKRSFYSFRNRYCIMGGYGGYKVVGHKNLDELNEVLNKVMLRRKKEEVLDLPPKLYKTEFIELTRKQQLLYKEIKQGIVENLESIMEIPNPLSCTVRLRQLTGGLFGDDNPKLDRIKDILEEITESGHKALIFSQWEKVTEVYRDALKEYNPAYIVGDVEVEDRQKEVYRFQNDPECKVAIGTIGAMGTGFTMNKASYVFFVDKKYWEAENRQAEDRAHRIGVEHTVNIISLVAKNTIDEGIEELLRENKELFDRVIEGKGSRIDIKAILTKILKL